MIPLEINIAENINQKNMTNITAINLLQEGHGNAYGIS